MADAHQRVGAVKAADESQRRTRCTGGKIIVDQQSGDVVRTLIRVELRVIGPQPVLEKNDQSHDDACDQQKFTRATLLDPGNSRRPKGYLTDIHETPTAAAWEVNTQLFVRRYPSETFRLLGWERDRHRRRHRGSRFF